MDYGFEAVISPRFADIFRNNSTKNGLVPVQVDAADGELLLAAVEADPTLEIIVDVERLVVSAPAIGLEVRSPSTTPPRSASSRASTTSASRCATSDDIDAFERDRPGWLPSTGATR